MLPYFFHPCGDVNSQDVELGQRLPAATVRRRGCCGGVCSFVLAHWSKAAVLALVITVIVLFSVRVGGCTTVIVLFSVWVGSLAVTICGRVQGRRLPWGICRLKLHPATSAGHSRLHRI